MDITCKQCNATYNIPDRQLPKAKASAECKRCGHKIVINAAPAAAAYAPAAPTPSETPTPAKQTDSAALAEFSDLAGFDADHYDLDALLKANKKGRYATKINKFKVKILTAVKPTLDRLLAGDEKVLRVAGGTAYYPIEVILGNGVFTMLYNRYALLATNRRLVMINTNPRMTETRHYLFQMRYEDLKKVSRGLFRTSLTLTPKKGKRRIFTSMKSAFTAELFNFIKPRLDLQKNIPAGGEIQTNLCPACYTLLGSRLSQCTSCHSAFKTPAAAAWRSLILPGLGDFYLGHRVLGGLEMVGALMVWLFFAAMLVSGRLEGIVLGAIVLIFANGFDALLTMHMAKKGYILARKQPAAESRAQLAPGNA